MAWPEPVHLLLARTDSRASQALRWGRESLADGQLNNRQFNDYFSSGPLTQFFQKAPDGGRHPSFGSSRRRVIARGISQEGGPAKPMQSVAGALHAFDLAARIPLCSPRG